MVNKWQTFFLIVLTLPIMGHVVLLPLAIDLAGRDSWISALIALPVGIVFLIGLYRLRLKYPKQPIPIALRKVLGNFLAIFTILLLFIYFSFLTSLSIASIVDMVSTIFLPATPVWVLVISFLLLSIYGATKSVKGIALTAGVLFFTVMFTGHSITFINFRERELFDLLPLLEYGWKPVLLGTLLLSNVWIELLFILVIPIKSMREKRIFAVWSLGIIANVMMMLSTISGTIMTFGLGQSESFVYPALEIVRIIDIDFIDRLDVYALILMTFGCFIRGSLFLKLSHEQVKSFLHKDKKWLHVISFIIVAILIGLISYYMGETRVRLEYFLIIYAYSIIFYPFLFLLLFVARMRKKKGYY